MHVRVESWFPMSVQIWINGHNWLGRQMDRLKMACRAVDNGFVWIGDFERAQRLANRFISKNWPKVLSVFARRVNPLMRGLLKGMNYYWVIDQAEYSSDVCFKDRAALKELFEALLKHATLAFRAEDVLCFLGRKLAPAFAGQVVNEMKKRYPGARVKHRMKENWLKMYDKTGSILRIETVINNPREFKVRRRGIRQGSGVVDWFPMNKGENMCCEGFATRIFARR